MNFRIIFESLFASVLYTLICIATHQTYFIGIFECFLCKNQDGWCLREKDISQRSLWGTFRKSLETEEKGGHLEWSNEWVGGGEDKSDQGNHRAEQGPETLHRCMEPRAEHRTPLSYENERFCRFTFNVDHISLPN